MKLNIIHGILIGMTVTSLAIHLNVYLGYCFSYLQCTTNYWIFGTWGYLIYWIFPYLVKLFKKIDKQLLSRYKKVKQPPEVE